MKYLYAIRKGPNNYHFGKTDVKETNIEFLCSSNCLHHHPIDASDCFREQLLKNIPDFISIEPRKCCFAKCAGTATEKLNYGYDFEFALCKYHQDKESVKKVCGFGFPLIIRENKCIILK